MHTDVPLTNFKSLLSFLEVGLPVLLMLFLSGKILLVLGVCFFAGGRSGEVATLFCCLTIFLILPWWVKCSPFLKNLSLFSFILSHHTPHSFVLLLQLVYSIGCLLATPFLLLLTSSVPNPSSLIALIYKHYTLL